MTAVCSLPECSLPCYVSNGHTHEFCGRTHAQVAVSSGQLKQQLRKPTRQLCALPSCYAVVCFDEFLGRVHDFCSRRHAAAARRQQGKSPGSRGAKVCRLSSCSEQVYRDPLSGVEKDYCGRTHARRHLNDTIQCKARGCDKVAWIDPHSNLSLKYCSSDCAGADDAELISDLACSFPDCGKKAMLHYRTRDLTGFCTLKHQSQGYVRKITRVKEPHVRLKFGRQDMPFCLSLLMEAHEDFKSVKKQFDEKWVKGPVVGKLERVFKIKLPKGVYRDYNAYKNRVTKQVVAQAAGRRKPSDPANVRRRFHGTSCDAACDFFANPIKGNLCSSKTCAACSICSQGFDKAHIGKTATVSKFKLRYGPGFYFTSVSGKANDYATGSQRIVEGRQFRLMFMCNVVGGRSDKATANRQPNGPTDGCHSLYADESTNGINYDEIVVYDPRAALPRFIISYSLLA